MKPLYKSKTHSLYLGDAVDVINQLEPKSIDLIFADPPYMLSNDGFTCHSGKQVSVNKGDWDKSAGVEADILFYERWITSCKRVLKDDGTLWISGTYHSIYICGFLLQKLGWHIINDIAWFKPNAAPNLACRQFAASHETLLWAKKHPKAKHEFNYQLMKTGDWGKDSIKNPNKQMRSVWVIPTTPKREKKFGKHPTQKPLALLERIILASSQAEGIILDPFCGSGTTGVAAVKHGRKFIGIELDIGYFEIAKLRIDAELNKGIS
ncbi:COG0863 DNA modification methylase [Methylophilaceae bacterium]